MKLKKELQQELNQAREELRNIKRIPCGHTLYYCPECGNPVLLNKGQHEERLVNGKKYSCSAGHIFNFYKS